MTSLVPGPEARRGPVAWFGATTSGRTCPKEGGWASVLESEVLKKQSLVPVRSLLQTLVAFPGALAFRISTPPHGTMSYLSGSLVCQEVPAAAYWARSAQNLEKVRENLLNF